MSDDAWMRGIVRGYTWKIRMFNGAVFEKWTPKDMNGKDAGQMMIDFSNGDYEDVCTNEDVVSLWKTNG